jgi:hypothetical protein
VKPTQAFVTVSLLILVAILSTGTGMKVSQRADYVDSLSKQIKDDETRIQVLRTELAYLSSPQRVQALVNMHRSDLGTPDTQQYVLNVSDVLPQEPAQPNIQLAVVKNASRAQADRLIAISLPKATVAPVAVPEPEPESNDSIAQIITTTDTTFESHDSDKQNRRQSLSESLQVAVQNVAAKDVMGR